MFYIVIAVLIGFLLYSLNRRIKNIFKSPFQGQQPQEKRSERCTPKEKVDITTIDKRKFDKDEGEYVSFEEEKDKTRNL